MAAAPLAEVFDPRANSIGFLRWLLAFAVIFSHAGPLGGFYGGVDLGIGVSKEQSLGGVAVAGFFFFSGFLITQSRMGSSTIFRFMWRRSLRIMPAFWCALLLTAFVLAPLGWMIETGSIRGFWESPNEPVWTYFLNNMWLELNQRNIAEGGSTLPLALKGGYDWNGSAWTLLYEFRAYILVAILGLSGILAYRWLTTFVAAAIMILNALQFLVPNVTPKVWFAFSDMYILMFFAPFAFGMLFTVWKHVIPIDDRLAVLAVIAAVGAYTLGGWNIWGIYAFGYFLMWFAIRVRALRGWDRPGDFSYGVYVFAWPIMQFVAYLGLQDAGWLAYHVVVIALVHILAFASWHLIEKPAMSLKNWTPRPLEWLYDRFITPAWERFAKASVDPRFSSTPRAERQRA